jgi:RNA polymerase sigma factor (TIGR02999 family)
MSGSDSRDITVLLEGFRNGSETAASQLMSLVYQELRKLAQSYMRGERPDHTLQATALVHEAYLKLCDPNAPSPQDRSHFFALAAQQMRRILVDHARSRNAEKRGGHQIRLSLEDIQGLGWEEQGDLVALDETLSRLETVDPRACRGVELRFFGGLTEEEISHVLGIGISTVKRDWEFAKAWLLDQLSSIAKDSKRKFGEGSF